MDNNYNNNYNNDYNYNNYNQGNGYPPQDRKGMAIASLILGIISIPLGCCAYLGVIPGIIAVFLGIFSKGAASRHSSKAIAGIITGAVGAVFGIIMTILSLKLMADPNFMAQYKELVEFYNKAK